MDTAALPFVLGFLPLIDADPYMSPRPKGDESPIINTFSIQCRPAINELPASDKSKLLYHVNKLTNVHRLYILPSVALDILTIIHGKDHLGFSCCYKIIVHS